jgi:hypothetical protein
VMSMSLANLVAVRDPAAVQPPHDTAHFESTKSK